MLPYARVLLMSLPSHPYDFAGQLLASQEFFNRSTGSLTEADSGFRPREGMMTAAQQVAHAAHTLDWFREGATRPEGFDLDFERHARELESVNSLAAARETLETAFASAIRFARETPAGELSKTLPDGPILGGLPKSEVIWAMVEHTAHHRGALSVYARLLDKVPPMPYGD